MKEKSLEDFEQELAEMASKLEQETGRVAPRDHEYTMPHSGISCDFELPYSSLPALKGQRWAHTS